MAKTVAQVCDNVQIAISLNVSKQSKIVAEK